MALSRLRESSRNCTSGEIEATRIFMGTMLHSGFVEVRGAHVFRGDYPSQLLGLWDKFAEEKGTENERPDMLGRDQTYIALEFNNAGDLGYPSELNAPTFLNHDFDQVLISRSLCSRMLPRPLQCGSR